MADEVEKAQAAKAGGDTIFAKILNKEIPCDVSKIVTYKTYTINDTATSSSFMRMIYALLFMTSQLKHPCIFS